MEKTNVTTTTATVKTTKRDYFAMLKAVVENAEVDNRDALLGFIEHEVDLLNKKHNSGAVNEETQKRMEVVFDCLSACSEPITITNLQKAFPEELADFSNQRISALLRKMKDKVVKTTKGKTSYFSVIAETAEEAETEETAEDTENA